MDSFDIIPVNGTPMCAGVLDCPMWFESDPKYHPFKEYKRNVFCNLHEDWTDLKFSAGILQEVLRKTMACPSRRPVFGPKCETKKGSHVSGDGVLGAKCRKSRLCYAVNFGHTSSVLLAAVFRT